jgi:Zn-dependent alcohol dehydrogenase
VRTEAALFRGVGEPFDVREVDLEDPRADDVLVEVEACGICGTDLHIVKGEWRRPLPMVLGHECAGVVRAVGEDVSRVGAGDRVVVSWAAACGACAACARGRPATCSALRAAIGGGTQVDGTTRLSDAGEPVYRMTTVGGFAGHVLMPERAIVPVPDDVSLDEAALLGCAALTGVGAVLNVGRVEPGASALVIGAGGVGQFVIQGARLAGAGRIVAVDPAPARRELALRLGATDAVAPAELDELEVDEGFDVAFDAVGGAATTALAVLRTRPSVGRSVIVGLPPAGGRLDLDLADLVVSERTVAGTIYGSEDPLEGLPRLVELARAGKLELRGLIAGSFALAEVDAAVAASLDGSPGRILVKPG